MKVAMKRPRPATVVAVIALIVALTGTAYATLARNSVGTRQLKAKSVTTSKIADNAVNGAKVANGSLGGADINLAALGEVPSAKNVEHAANANTLGSGHGASCPSGTVLIRGLCYESSPSGPVTGVKAAADKCVAAGGWLPTPEQLVSVRTVLNLGDGTGTHSEFTDSYYLNTTGGEPRTTVVSENEVKSVLNENLETHEIVATYDYICVYQLIR